MIAATRSAANHVQGLAGKSARASSPDSTTIPSTHSALKYWTACSGFVNPACFATRWIWPATTKKSGGLRQTSVSDVSGSRCSSVTTFVYCQLAYAS